MNSRFIVIEERQGKESKFFPWRTVGIFPSLYEANAFRWQRGGGRRVVLYNGTVVTDERGTACNAGILPPEEQRND